MERIRDEGVAVAESCFRRGRPANEIVKLGEKLGAGLVAIAMLSMFGYLS